MNLKDKNFVLTFKGIVLIFFFINVRVDLSSNDVVNELSLDLSIRYRFELWDGMNAKNFGDNTSVGNLNDELLLQRFIAGFSHRISDMFSLGLHFQDSRAFGWSLGQAKEPDVFKIKKAGTKEPFYVMNPNEEFFEIYDFYLAITNIVDSLSIIVGRQKIFESDGRVFGPGDWGNTGRWTWDALKFTYCFGGNYVDLWAGGTKIHNPLKMSIPFTETEYWGLGFYSSLSLSKSMKIEPYLALKKNGSADYIRDLEIFRYWFGFRFIDSNLYKINYELNYVRELGREAGQGIMAYGLFARVGYKFSSLPTKPLLSIRYSYASGGFDPVFGAQDKFYGWMNVVSWSNLDDRELVVELFPMRGLWIEFKYNSFRIPLISGTKILGTMELNSAENHLGDEIDLFVKYNANDSWQFVGVIGKFFPAEAVLVNSKVKPKSAFLFALQATYFFRYFFY